MKESSQSNYNARNCLSFWVFGLANNIAYVVMLCGAKDILGKEQPHDESSLDAIHHHLNLTSSSISAHANVHDECLPTLSAFKCTKQSTGYVLLCNIVPALIVKILAPFFIHRIPYSLRQIIICLMQGIALLLVSQSNTVFTALCGVLICSLAYGFGESSFLGLASHFDKNTIGAWSSGSGAAGIVGSCIYAALTDHNFISMKPSTAMLVMLVFPMFALLITYFYVLQIPSTIRRLQLNDPSTWIDVKIRSSNSDSVHDESLAKKLKHLTSLYKYMIPLCIVYFTEYLINQGLHELTVFDCKHSFYKSPTEQYRWFAVCYAIGVFISRSAINLFHFGMFSIALMPFLQMINLIIFAINSMNPFMHHFSIAAIIVIYEGLIGGWAYANAFHHIHRKVDEKIREFALSAVSIADATGILIAALSAIPTHNLICEAFYPPASHHSPLRH